VVTHCRDRELHRRRVEGRVRGIPGWDELDWDHVGGVLDRWEPPIDADLRLDAVDPLEANFKLLTDLVLAAAVK
jgi:hypothetical protein